MNIPQAVLFDMDGVLVQTELLKAKAHAAAVTQLGGQIELAFYTTVMGQSMEAVELAFCRAGRVEDALSQYRQLYETVYHSLLQTQLAVTPGVIQLLQQLQTRNYRLGVVTSDHAATMKDVLTQTSLIQFFEVCIARDDVACTKPAPDAYLAALHGLNLPASAVIVIEDTESGVQAAVGAGLRVLALHHSFNTCHNFKLASQMITSFLEPGLIQSIETTFQMGN